MKIKHRIFSVMLIFVVMSCGIYSYQSHEKQRNLLMKGINEKLYTAAVMARAILPEDYHDHIVNVDSVSTESFDRIVDQYNKICLKLGLDYIWSVIQIDGKLFFTSSTSPDKNVINQKHAKFFEAHQDPMAFQVALKSMNPHFSSFHNEWGHGRMVLVPERNVLGDVFIFGASMKLSEVELLLSKNIEELVYIGLGFIVIGLFFSYIFASLLSRFLKIFIIAATKIEDGNLDIDIAEKGSYEEVMLARGFNRMSRAIKENISALTESEENFRTLVENIPGASYRCACDEHWTMEYISSEIENISGYPVTDFLQNSVRSYASIIAPEDRKIVDAIVLEAIKNKEKFTVEYRIIHFDGSIRWIYERGQGIFDESGKILHLDGTILDITERKEVENALIESEEKFRLMFETSPVGMAMCEMDGTLVQVNQAYLDIIGYTNEEALNCTYWDVTPKEYAQAEAEQLRSMEETGKYGPYQKEYIHKTGKRVPVLLNGMIVIGGDKVKRIWSLVEDITERRISEEKIKVFQSAVAASTDAIGMSTAAGVHYYQNEAFDSMFGKVGQDPPATLFVDQSVGREVFNTIMNGDSWIGEVQMNGVDGEKLDVFLRAYAIKDEDGQVVSLVGVNTDITERKKYEKELRDNLREKTTLLQEIHHRVKNNMIFLQGLITLQQGSLTGVQDANEILETVKRRIQSVGLAHQLLYQSEDLSSIDFSSYIVDVVNEIRKIYDIDEKKIKASFDLDHVMMNIEKAVPAGLIVSELLVNAFKHAFSGRKDGYIKVSLKIEEKFNELVISDDGVGMPKGFSWKDSGTLGLRLVKNLTRQIKGEIEYKEKDGSVFTLRF